MDTVKKVEALVHEDRGVIIQMAIIGAVPLHDMRQKLVSAAAVVIDKCTQTKVVPLREFLKFMVSMQKAKRVLDIGMFTGYSALAMAEALPADGVVITCDFEQYLQEINRKKSDESPHGAKVDIRIGDAKHTLRSLANEGQKFDFIFADADKEKNQNYYNIIMDQGLLAPNGTIVFDNAFRGGQAFLMDDDPMDRLNTQVEKDPRVRRVLILVRDGMLLVRRAEEVIA